ncbi:MAG: acetoin utilization protein AcuC [Micrococcaceae bacterium]
MNFLETSHAKPATKVVWDEALLKHDFGPSHPMKPLRLELTTKLMSGFGLFDLPHVSLLKPRMASNDELSDTHAYEYISAVRRAAQGQKDLRRGLGSDDVPLFPSMHNTSALICGASMLAADSIISGEAVRAFNFSGGMHHASKNKASGFCVYNDPAVAIHRFLDAGYSKILYLDLDAHHGDGVQSIFWQDPRVLTISIHESGESLFPGTGTIDEIGAKNALGKAVNIPLPAGTADAEWLRAFYAVVPPLIEAWKPEVIVSQHGCDTHRCDPLTHLQLSIEGMRMANLKIRDLAQTYCDGKWLATGGGGYNVIDVVPRTWTSLLSVMADQELPLDSPLPQIWQDELREAQLGQAPEKLGDGEDVWFRSWEIAQDLTRPVDRMISKLRQNIFPYYNLDPWLD